MRLKNGYQRCPKCEGNGCYWCRRTGHMAQCPVCGNHEPELVTKDQDVLTCKVCENKFSQSGNLLDEHIAPM